MPITVRIEAEGQAGLNGLKSDNDHRDDIPDRRLRRVGGCRKPRNDGAMFGSRRMPGGNHWARADRRRATDLVQVAALTQHPRLNLWRT